MTSVCINGLTGRMGQALQETAAGREDVTVTAGIGPEPGTVDDLSTYQPGQTRRALEAEQPAVVLDFSTPAGTRRVARACQTTGTGLVVGTTDLGAAEHEALAAVGQQAPVLQASSFARGIQALVSALDAALGALPEYDVELLETHHSGKRDAPSGTAAQLLSTVGRHREFETVSGREGSHPRDDDEVGVFARRAGTVRGEHEVLLAGNDELLTLTHRAEDRGVFAAGALDAAVWLDGQPPGEYSFAAVVREGIR